MPKFYIDVPDAIHRKVKWLQLDKADKNQKVTLNKLYNDIIREGLKSMGKAKTAP